MVQLCSHLDAIQDSPPSDDGCHECLREGGTWVHLRMCQSCGHIGCCDSSPGHHATTHHRSTTHPLVRSFEPAQDWFYCHPDDVAFVVVDAPPAPSRP